MNKSKKLLIASIITYFLPFVVAPIFLVLAFNRFGFTPFFVFLLGMLPGLVLYFIVPIFKKHYYEKKDDPKERKLAIITTSIECGAPILIDIILFFSALNYYSDDLVLLIVRILYILFFVPFLLLNLSYWRSFPKEEKEE